MASESTYPISTEHTERLELHETGGSGKDHPQVPLPQVPLPQVPLPTLHSGAQQLPTLHSGAQQAPELRPQRPIHLMGHTVLPQFRGMLYASMLGSPPYDQSQALVLASKLDASQYENVLQFGSEIQHSLKNFTHNMSKLGYS